MPRFLRYAAEENLRRHFNMRANKISSDKELLLKILFPEHKKFLARVQNMRKEELKFANKRGIIETKFAFQNLDAEVYKIKGRFNFPLNG